jgi:hypothetical protein
VQNVVWEKLDDLMGNTQFLKADFTPYGSNSLAEQVSDAADLVQAAFAGVGPNKSQATDGTHSLICLIVCSCTYDSLIYPFTHSLAHWLTHSFVDAFTHSVFQSSIHPFMAFRINLLIMLRRCCGR